MQKYDHITINGTGVDKKDYHNVSSYEHAVLHQLKHLHASRTGTAVIHAIAHRKKTLTIVPYNDHTEDNAYAAPTDYQHSTLKGGLERYNGDVKNSPYDKKAGHNVDETGLAVLDGKGKAIQGLGGGSDSIIKFSPSTWFHYIHKHKGHTCGAHADEILLHEMVHALRQMLGIAESLYVGSLYDTEEEFFAILIANIYASERHRANDIRSDHHGFDALAHNQDSSAKFLPSINPKDYHYVLIHKLVHEEPALCHRLAHVHAHFNPIRRYFELHRHHHHHHHHP